MGYNYHTPGYYFLINCQHDRSQLFAKVETGSLFLTPAGEMISSAIREIAERFDFALVDCAVVMPNHVHILLAVNLSDKVPTPVSVVDVMQWWKTVTTKRYIQGVKNLGWPRFSGSLWQTGYHDRIVRTEKELETIRKYIAENPQRWEADTFYDVSM